MDSSAQRYRSTPFRRKSQIPTGQQAVAQPSSQVNSQHTEEKEACPHTCLLQSTCGGICVSDIPPKLGYTLSWLPMQAWVPAWGSIPTVHTKHRVPGKDAAGFCRDSSRLRALCEPSPERLLRPVLQQVPQLSLRLLSPAPQSRIDPCTAPPPAMTPV